MNRSKLGLLDGLSALDVANRLRNASDQEGLNRRVLSFYLFDMNERRLYMQSGHRSTTHFAITQLEMDERRTNELIQAGAALRGLEALDEAFCRRDVSWSKVVAMLPVVQAHTQIAWVEFAAKSTYRVLRDTVRGCRPGDLPENTKEFRRIRAHAIVQANLNDNDLARFEYLRTLLQTDPDKPLTDTYVIRYCIGVATPDFDPAKSPASRPSAERNTEEIPAETRTAVLKRDKHRCRSCHAPHSIEIHHISYRAQGGSNKPTNLAVLCDDCHTLVHRDLLRPIGNPQTQHLHFLSASGVPIERSPRPLVSG